MEDQTQDFYTLDQYEVKLTKIDDRLLIEIEAPLAAKSFSIEFTSPMIPQATNDIFPDVSTMYQGLQDALLKTHPEVSIYFDGYGGLAYQVSFSVGVIKKEHKFTLDLIEKKLDPLLRLEKKMENKLAQIMKKVSEIEKQIQPEGGLTQTPEINQTGKEEILKIIERLEGRIFEKLDNMEKRVTALEEQKTGNNSSDIDVNKILNALSRLEIPKETQESSKAVTQDFKVLFDSSSSKASGFAFSNGNKTVEFADPNLHFEIPFNKELPKTGKIVLSVKLEVIPNSIWIGIISEEHLSKACWYEFDINYLTAGGIVFNNAVATMPAKEASSGFGKAGDVVSMVVDIDEGLIVFQVNGSEVNLIKVELQGKMFIPYCGAFEKGCKITVI